jgi:delta14-sterol reductase
VMRRTRGSQSGCAGEAEAAASPARATPARKAKATPEKSRGRSAASSPARASSASPPASPSAPPAPPSSRKLRSAVKAEKAEVEKAEVAKSEHAVEYEFGGPIGAVGVIVGLPAVIYALYFVCNQDVCLTNALSAFDWRAAWGSVPCCLYELFSWEASAMYLGWMAVQVLLERLLPGEVVEGAALPAGPGGGGSAQRLSYKLSGHLQFWVTLAVLTHGWVSVSTGPSGSLSFLSFGAFPLHLVYDHYLGLISISVLFSFLLSVFLYGYSFLPNADGTAKLLAKGGDTGDMIYDFFIGRELNPRIGSFDLKEFCELRPGLMLWAVVNVGMALKQLQTRGSVSMSMALMVLFQGGYVWDAVHAERAILTTMDITTDGFGYMLAFGDLSWVPFIYTLQARYLVDYDPNLPTLQIAIIAAIHFLGYFIFRSANSQKDAFRRDPTSPEVSHLSFMETQRGTRLITSGWWGAARKINYTGDWLIALSWCLLCGFDSPVPYFHAIYFLVLLIHRTLRDDMMCTEKYGDDWAEYKKRVPYVFVPGVI